MPPDDGRGDASRRLYTAIIVPSRFHFIIFPARAALEVIEAASSSHGRRLRRPAYCASHLVYAMIPMQYYQLLKQSRRTPRRHCEVRAMTGHEARLLPRRRLTQPPMTRHTISCSFRRNGLTTPIVGHASTPERRRRWRRKRFSPLSVQGRCPAAYASIRRKRAVG